MLWEKQTPKNEQKFNKYSSRLIFSLSIRDSTTVGIGFKFDVVLRLIPSNTGRVFQYWWRLLSEQRLWKSLHFCLIAQDTELVSQRKLYLKQNWGFFCFPLYIHLMYLTEQELSIFPSRNQCYQESTFMLF